MRKWISYSILILLLAGGVILCAVRWQAWFGMPAEPKWTGDTINYVFPSPQSTNPLTPNHLTVLVLGDIHSKMTRADYDTLAARVPQTDVVVQVGDWMDRGQEYYYQLLLREWTASDLYGKPVIACPGNHEYSKGLHKTLSPTWENAFPHPDNGPVGVPGASYFVDMPSVRFIAIDTNPLIRTVYLTRTLTWLREAIDNAGERFTVVLMHHPVLSPAKGRFNPMIYSAFRHVLGDADIVFAGHDHSYMRHMPFVVLNSAGKTKPQHLGFSAEVADTVPVYGVLSVETGMQFNVYRLSDNTQIDSVYVKHD